MTKFKSLRLSILVDILSDFTMHYTEMLTSGSYKREDVKSWRHIIHLLRSEINYRNRSLIFARTTNND